MSSRSPQQTAAVLDPKDVSRMLTRGVTFRDDDVIVDAGGFQIAVRSNSKRLLARLDRYFAPFAGGGEPDVTVSAVEAAPFDETQLLEQGIQFRDWRRELGKTGRKDAYCDLRGARLVRKVRTGMLFLQNRQGPLAFGPCCANDNQVVNFINSQYMNWLQQNGALICHAAGVVLNGQCLAIAGMSGAGKSSLALKVIDSLAAGYLTNDRLMLRTNGRSHPEALGITKLPRVNPGTILGNARLHEILEPERLAELRAMDDGRLWSLEQKHDVDVEGIFGAGSIRLRAPLGGILILNWERNANSPVRLRKVNLQERPDLLGALMKSPGPFYQDARGRFQDDRETPDPVAYCQALNGIPCWEATGRINFAAATERCIEIMEANLCSKS